MSIMKIEFQILDENDQEVIVHSCYDWLRDFTMENL